MSSETEGRGPSLGARALAVLVLVIAGWIVLKFLVGIIAGVFWLVLAVVAVVAVIWAWRTLF